MAALLKAIYMIVYWNNINEFWNLMTNKDMEKRCGKCALFGCHHTIGFRTEVNQFLEKNAMTTYVDGIDVRPTDPWADTPYSDAKRTSTIPMGKTDSSERRVLIPPPPPLPTTVRDMKDLSSSASPAPPTNEFVHCSLCSGRVHIHYLDQHMKIHIHQYVPKVAASSSTSSGGDVSRALVRVDNMDDIINRHSTSSTSTSKPPEVKLSTPEIYRFRQIDNVCATSSVSQDGRYSDFTVVFWGKEKTGIHSTTYSGTYNYGSSSTTSYSDWERLQVHVVYDSLEDYYTVNCKLIKRGQYSSWDSEEGVPDGICLQSELFTNIKRAMLYFRISPKEAGDLFAKLMQQPLVIDYDDSGRACIVQTENCEELNERLKKTYTSTSSSSSYSEHGDYDYRGHPHMAM